MPFTAEHPDTGVALTPSDVSEKFRRRQDLLCPYCSETLRYRKHGTNDAGEKVRRAHFWHTDNVGGEGGPGGCARGGESAEHEEWKMIVGQLLKEEHAVEEYFIEHKIGKRTADVLVKNVSGLEGVVAEYQHKNKGKDYLAVTKEYVKNGYGVHWIFNTNSDYEMLFTAKEELERYMGRSPYLGERNFTKVSSDELVKFGETISIEGFDPQPSGIDRSWAIFFDLLGVDYRYQAEYVDTAEGTYLPDFYLSNAGVRSTENTGMWFEVSNDVPEKWKGGVFERMGNVVEKSQKPAGIADGSPDGRQRPENLYEVNLVDPDYEQSTCVDWPMEWMKCDDCDSIKLEFQEGSYMHCEYCGGGCGPDHDDIEIAIQKVQEKNRDRVLRELFSRESLAKYMD